MATTTLTSLAMLKVHIDQGQDYLDYLRPFILQVLIDYKPEPVTDIIIRDHIRHDFGLEIPDRAIQIVLKRLSRRYPLKKENYIYRIIGLLPDPHIRALKADADRHIKSVVAGLIEFSKNTAMSISSESEAVNVICAFLSKFNIQCLRAYLRGTTIPDIEDQHNAQIVLVSKYVLILQNSDPERFESFLVVVRGHMLANALLCPDLQSAPKTYKRVTFFLDTPLLIRRLDLEGNQKKAAVENLIELLHNLGATVAIFSHSRNELERVINGAATHLGDPNSRSNIVMEARRRGTSKSDLLLIVGQLDDFLKKARIDVIKTPGYIDKYQIAEDIFEKVLDDEVSYFNSRAREYDINSVRSIYVLRAGTSPMRLEKSKAVLVTSNVAFSKAAFQFGQKYEESSEVSSVITDFSLANMAWLKAPLGAPSLPSIEVLAFSYAALQPSRELLDKYLNEIEKLEKKGKITARDHQLLRSSQFAQDELINLTLGEEDALTEQTVTETLKRVTEDIKKEESDKLKSEENSHKETREKLEKEKAERKRLHERLFWRLKRRAKIYAYFVSIIIIILLIIGLFVGFGLKSKNQICGWIFIVASAALGLWTIGNLIFGITVKQLHSWVQDRFLTLMIKRESAAIRLDLFNNQ